MEIKSKDASHFELEKNVTWEDYSKLLNTYKFVQALAVGKLSAIDEVIKESIQAVAPSCLYNEAYSLTQSVKKAEDYASFDLLDSDTVVLLCIIAQLIEKPFLRVLDASNEMSEFIELKVMAMAAYRKQDGSYFKEAVKIANEMAKFLLMRRINA